MRSEKSINKINEQKLHDFMLKAVGDIASTMSAMLLIIGDRLGLYKAMAESGQPITSDELAKKTNTNERIIREWLANQAAGGYITYNASDGKYTIPPEQAMALADENSPVYIHGAYQSIRSFFKDEDKFIEMFKSGKGLRWGEHHHDLFEGTARFFKPNYIGNLVSSWIPSLDGVEEKLKQGAKVADIGCGYGISTTLMAKAYPNSKFYGFDNHSPSIEQAKELSKKEGITGNVEFSSISANDKSIGNDYDLITFFDCLHDMGDPIGAMKFAKQSLKPDGTCMIIEPMANDKIEENLNLVGRTYYAASTLVCVPNSLADNGPALGAQAGEKKIKEISEAAGFTKFRRAIQTLFNIIYEAKP
ncbi:MAG TPA: methyltransferase domain-containing protein [Nitrososphaeraceae archaeon]|jgi:2-polyprenyl-3-methyl-5-hydroxy-6-metoxy-1,4-benzoquinol methylase|nr:methyltransferase domain-containing protein [Nitrososphaeraceae archaeon]